MLQSESRDFISSFSGLAEPEVGLIECARLIIPAKLGRPGKMGESSVSGNSRKYATQVNEDSVFLSLKNNNYTLHDHDECFHTSILDLFVISY